MPAFGKLYLSDCVHRMHLFIFVNSFGLTENAWLLLGTVNIELQLQDWRLKHGKLKTIHWQELSEYHLQKQKFQEHPKECVWP